MLKGHLFLWDLFFSSPFILYASTVLITDPFGALRNKYLYPDFIKNLVSIPPINNLFGYISSDYLHFFPFKIISFIFTSSLILKLKNSELKKDNFTPLPFPIIEYHINIFFFQTSHKNFHWALLPVDLVVYIFLWLLLTNVFLGERKLVIKRNVF